VRVEFSQRNLDFNVFVLCQGRLLGISAIVGKVDSSFWGIIIITPIPLLTPQSAILHIHAGIGLVIHHSLSIPPHRLSVSNLLNGAVITDVNVHPTLVNLTT
jgi:hypothetical protein